MSDLVRNPEDRFSSIAAHMCVFYSRCPSGTEKVCVVEGSMS